MKNWNTVPENRKKILEKSGCFEKRSDRKCLEDWKRQTRTEEGWGELWEHVSWQNEEFLRVPGRGGCRQGVQAHIRSAAVATPAVMFVTAPPTTEDSCHFVAQAKKYGGMWSPVLRDQLQSSPRNLELLGRKWRTQMCQTNTGWLGVPDMIRAKKAATASRQNILEP